MKDLLDEFGLTGWRLLLLIPGIPLAAAIAFAALDFVGVVTDLIAGETLNPYEPPADFGVHLRYAGIGLVVVLVFAGLGVLNEMASERSRRRDSERYELERLRQENQRLRGLLQGRGDEDDV